MKHSLAHIKAAYRTRKAKSWIARQQAENRNYMKRRIGSNGRQGKR